MATVSSGTARGLSLIFSLLICYVAGIALVDENTVRTAAIGFGVIIVLLSEPLAARYADHLVAIRRGQVHVAGAPTRVLTEEMVEQVFGLPCRVITDPTSGQPMMLPLGRHHAVPAPARKEAQA